MACVIAVTTPAITLRIVVMMPRMVLNTLPTSAMMVVPCACQKPAMALSCAPIIPAIMVMMPVIMAWIGGQTALTLAIICSPFAAQKAATLAMTDVMMLCTAVMTFVTTVWM